MEVVPEFGIDLHCAIAVTYLAEAFGSSVSNR